MSEKYEVVYLDEPEWGIIGGGIHDYNTRLIGPSNEKNLCFVLKGPEQEIIGGVIGATYWGWFYINLMWVEDAFRGRGYGQHLLKCAEDEARERGAKYAYLDTFSFQAPEFYLKQGYQVFGELQDFPPGHQRFFLRKTLV